MDAERRAVGGGWPEFFWSSLGVLFGLGIPAGVRWLAFLRIISMRKVVHRRVDRMEIR